MTPIPNPTTEFQYQDVISGSATRIPLFNAPLSVVYDAITGNVAALDRFFSAEVYAAENALPEGERVEVTITGWTVPLIGSVGQTVANDLNQQWQQGKIHDPMYPTESLPAWPEFPTEIASYDPSTDELVLRYRKGQPWFIWIAGAILAILGIGSLLNMVGLGSGHYLYNLFGVTPKSSSGSGGSTSSSGWPLWEKILVFGGGGLALAGGLWFAAELKLREAGANKSQQEIVIER